MLILYTIGIVVWLMLLVLAQMLRAEHTKCLVVEQVVAGEAPAGLTFDRHYGMMIDFTILSGFLGLIVLLSGAQWTRGDLQIAILIAIAVATLLVVMWMKLAKTPEPHSDVVAAILHGIYTAIAIGIVTMLLFFTPRPEPALLLVFGIVVPAFLFTGQHMYLGLINWMGDAKTYPDRPLRSLPGWIIFFGVTALAWWRILILLPDGYWASVLP